MTRAERVELGARVDAAVRLRDLEPLRVESLRPARFHSRCVWCGKRCIGGVCPQHRDVEQAYQAS